jgi:hypothetical protein
LQAVREGVEEASAVGGLPHYSRVCAQNKKEVRAFKRITTTKYSNAMPAKETRKQNQTTSKI